jgi:ABC-type branched-subunit amino acid transport system permease subunit
MYFIMDLLVLGCINGIMVTGLNIQYGYNGLLNVAFYTYVAIGAYVAGIITLGKPTIGATYILGWHLPWYVGLLAAGIVASLFSAFVFCFSVRRLRSDYLAIVTVAAAYIFYNVVNSDTSLVDGATGLFDVPYILDGANLSAIQYSLVILAVSAAILALCMIAARRIFRSPLGRLLRAIREDESVPIAFGRVIWRPQLIVYVLGCFMGGLAGAMFIFYLTAWSPLAFLPTESFFLLAAIIVGGTGNYWGALFGGFVVIEALNELLRYLPDFGHPADFGAIRVILIGIGLLAMLRFRSEGLFPERWLHWYGTASGRRREVSLRFRQDRA